MENKFVMSVPQAAKLDLVLLRSGWTSKDVDWLLANDNLVQVLKLRDGSHLVTPRESIRFPTWRLIRRTLASSQDAESKLEEAGCKISDWAREVLPKVVFVGNDEYELIAVSPPEMGLRKGNYSLSDIYVVAKQFGLEPCPAWVGPQLRLDYLDQPLNEWLIIAMEELSDSIRHGVFRIGCNNVGLNLHSNVAFPNSSRNSRSRIIFARCK